MDYLQNQWGSSPLPLWGSADKLTFLGLLSQNLVFCASMRQPFLLVPLLLLLGCSRDLADEGVSVYFTPWYTASQGLVNDEINAPVAVRLGDYYWGKWNDNNQMSILGFQKIHVQEGSGNADGSLLLVPSDVESFNLVLEYSKTRANQKKYEAWKNEKVKEEDNE